MFCAEPLYIEGIMTDKYFMRSLPGQDKSNRRCIAAPLPLHGRPDCRDTQPAFEILQGRGI